RGSGVKTGVGLPGTRIPKELNSSLNMVSPAYFDTMGIRLVAGRGFVEADGTRKNPSPVIVNQSFVRRFFPEGSALGRRFGNGMGSVATPSFEIVGVVNDSRYRSLREPFLPVYYGIFYGQDRTKLAFFQLEVRTWERPETVIASVESLVHRLGPGVPV